MPPTTESDTINWPLCSVMFEQMADHFQWNYLNVKVKKESKKRWMLRWRKRRDWKTIREKRA
jgi:hypothetical protein